MNDEPQIRVANQTSLRAGDPVYDEFRAWATEFVNGRWGRLNAYWLPRTYLHLSYDGRYYNGRIKYTSSQGTSTVTSKWYNVRKKAFIA